MWFMNRSICICSPQQPVEFRDDITYHNETVFKRFNGTVIGICSNCGVRKTFPATVNTAYDPVQSRAEFYEESAEKFRTLFKPVVDLIMQYKNKGAVLDVGCSSGILLELLRERGFDVYGIEPNKAAHEAAEKKFPQRIFRGTLKTYLEKNHRSFDVIIYNHVLEHIPYPLSELSLAKKILHTKGILVIGLPNTQNIIFSVRRKFWEPLMPNEHIWHFGKTYMKRLLQKEGLSVKKIRFEDDPRRDYPIIKRLYFGLLSLINKCTNTGEAMLLICERT